MLMGMEFYAYQVQFSDHIPVHHSDSGKSPRWNFDTPANSLTTIFIVTVGDDWNFIMYDHFRALMDKSKNGATASLTIIFFVVLYIMMNLMMLNLLLAILLKSHSSKPTDEDMIKEAEEEENNEEFGPLYVCAHFAILRVKNCWKSVWWCWYEDEEDSEPELVTSNSNNGSVLEGQKSALDTETSLV